MVRDFRRLLQLLTRDLEAGRAVLRSVVKDVTLRPVGQEIEITIQGTLQGILTAEGIVPVSGQTREIVLCGNRGSGGRI